jgi:hypothetical protein
MAKPDRWPDSCASVSDVIRASVFVVVLTLAIGPGAPLVCLVCCQSTGATSPTTTAGCEHQDFGAAVITAAHETCYPTLPGATAIVRDESKHGEAGASARAVIDDSAPGAGFLWTDATRIYRVITAPTLESPPRLLTLRI